MTCVSCILCSLLKNMENSKGIIFFFQKFGFDKHLTMDSSLISL